MKLKQYEIDKKLNQERIKELIKASTKLDKINWRIMICAPSQKAKLRQLEMLKTHYAGILGITYKSEKVLNNQ